MSSTTLERQTTQDAMLGIVDCDIHPSMSSPGELAPYLSARWREHLASFGGNARTPLIGGLTYPRYNRDGGSRLDAKPPSGKPAGSDLDFMRAQHLDPANVAIGILQPMGPNGISLRNQELGAALASAMNLWQLEHWCAVEPRLRAGLIVPQEDPIRALAEIERHGGNRTFAQLFLTPRGLEPLGRQRYWPIFEAAEAYDLPIGLHVGGWGGHSATGSGTHSYYLEDHHLNAESMQALMTSLIAEGVFDRFPKLKIVLIEGGFVWCPSLCWRMDKHWARFKAEMPTLQRLPSEYVRDHFWFTTQPIDEPADARHLAETIDWLGWDRICFSSDYPHWDYDDHRFIFKFRLTEAQKRLVFRDNAMAAFRLA